MSDRDLSTLGEFAFLLRVYRKSVRNGNKQVASMAFSMIASRIASFVLLPITAGCYAFVVVALIAAFNT